jgi:hypothetical protein
MFTPHYSLLFFPSFFPFFGMAVRRRRKEEEK